MAKLKKNITATLMAVVIVAGLLIAFPGIVLVSRQKNARLLDIRDDYKGRLTTIGRRMETDTKHLLEKVFQQAEETSINPANQESIIAFTKSVLMTNPIVRYPFIMDSNKRFIFPIAGKKGLPAPDSPDLGKTIKKRAVKELYITGSDLEYKQKNYIDAVRTYQKAQNAGAAQDVRLYIAHAIGRCYFKLKQFHQSEYYYRDVLRRRPAVETIKNDRFFYLSTLRQLAVSLDGMKDRKKAAAVYLTLYEETQIHDTPGRGNPFAFYKNEALAYLNRHSRTSVPKTSGQAGDGKDDTATEKLNVLRRTTSMDISLRWLYFENEGTTADERETGGGEYRFSKLRELYESSDEKTKFYKEVKQNPALPGAEVTHMRIISGHIEGKNIAVALKPLGTGTTGQTLYFGFMPAPDFIRSDILATAAGELLKKNDSIIDFSNPVPANKAIRGKTKLLTVPFQSVPEGRALSLYSDNADFFETLVRKEIRLYYLLLSALVLVLVSGGFLFYKYLARESQLMRMKAEFVDGASHTLKTPLTRISLMAENVKRGWVTDEAKKEEFFNTIISETARMSEMIDNMLNFSRIEAGKQFYEPGKVYLQEIAGELLEHIAGDARERGFQFSVEMDENLPALQLDGKAVKLVVSNLLENALKYSLKEKDISFRLFKEKGFVVLEIRDRGMGIPKKEIPHIFKKFYRVPDAGIKALEGSGLGLFLVSHAVEAQQGKITVNSEEGKGSTFTVCFPMDKNASKPGVKK